MDLGLKGKVALVAAASRGLGRAVAEELAAEGASLVLCARGAGPLADACAHIERTSGVAVLGVAGDVSLPADVSRIVGAGLERFGRIDVLVTNAGGPPAGTFASLSPLDWEAAGWGPGLVDLAALVSGSWSDQRRGAITDAYRHELGRWKPGPPPEEFAASLDVCRLHLAVQYVGWSPSWSPPPHQAHDWVGEAVAIADRLGL